MPVCVFIDDLDRCGADYVVNLLEGIQTLFRHKKVAYVVAADRNWIKASFEVRYAPFSVAVGSAGQPLGYLFLRRFFKYPRQFPAWECKADWVLGLAAEGQRWAITRGRFRIVDGYLGAAVRARKKSIRQSRRGET